MGNFFLDNKDIQFLFDELDMKELARIQELDAENGSADYVPVDELDAADNYRRILEIVGEVAADTIAPNAEAIDRGSHDLKEDGTVNRIALPAIFNPEDLNALELALQLRERCGARVVVCSMGPPSAADILRHDLMGKIDQASIGDDAKDDPLHRPDVAIGRTEISREGNEWCLHHRRSFYKQAMNSSSTQAHFRHIIRLPQKYNYFSL